MSAKSSGVISLAIKSRSGQEFDEALAAPAGFVDIRRGHLGERVAQRVVIARAGKGKGRDQRAAADARHDRVFGTLAGGGQAVEQTGAERPILASARKNEPGAGLRRQGILEVRFCVAPEPRFRDAGNGRDGVLSGREGNARRQLRLCVRSRGRPLLAGVGLGGSLGPRRRLRRRLRFCPRRGERHRGN